MAAWCCSSKSCTSCQARVGAGWPGRFSDAFWRRRGVGVASAQATSSLLRIHVDESNALALPVWSKCRCENARKVISDGEMSMVFSWSTRLFVTLSLKIPFSTPPLFSASLSLRPVSQSRVPLGWRMRKHEAHRGRLAIQLAGVSEVAHVADAYPT